MIDRRTLVQRLFFAGIGTLIVRPSWGNVPSASGNLSFLVIGDWGTGGSLQRTVAAGMAKVAAAMHPSFIMSTGDNIYPNGVSHANDPQWRTKFERIYDDAALDLPWWAVLGNHDYRTNPDAQIAYHQYNARWNMPSRYYTTQFPLGDVTSTAVYGLDTQQLVTKSDGWQKQLSWLRGLLETSTAALHVAVGHHPLRSYGHYGDSTMLVNNLKPIFDDHNVDLYCCGHDHDLQIIRNPSDAFCCVVSGGGGGSRATVQGKHSLYAASNGGFMMVTCSERTIDVRAYNANGTQMHLETIVRRTQ